MLNPILNDNIGNYFLGTESEVWFFNQLLLPTAAIVPTTGFTITAAAAVGATSLTITALTAPISRNQRILNAAGTRCFLVTAAAAIGATTLTVAPLLGAIVANDTATFDSMIPYYTAMDAGFDVSGEDKELRNFGAGFYAIKGKTKLSAEFKTDGYLTKGDPGVPLLRDAAGTNKIMYIHYITPDDTCTVFYAQAKSLSLATQTDEYMKFPATYTLGSAPQTRNLALR